VRRAAPGRGNVDEVYFYDTLLRDVDRDGKRRIPAGCSIFVRGWAFNPKAARPAHAVLGSFDDGTTFAIAYGRSRPDIALTFGVPEVEPCGFQGMYPLAGLSRGHHVLKIVTLDEANGYHELPGLVPFEIVPSRELFRGVERCGEERMKISIDSFTALRSGAIPIGGALLVKDGDVVYLRGWAIDLERRAALHGAYAIVDDEEYVLGVHGLPREDIARTLRLPDAVRCGFTLRFSTRGLRPGPHALRVAALTPDDTYGIVDVGTLEVA
jgi:hypothetical protein